MSRELSTYINSYPEIDRYLERYWQISGDILTDIGRDIDRYQEIAREISGDI